MAKYIGKSVRRKEDRRFLTGAGNYVGDMRLPDMVHAVVLRSQMAHARIVSIDVERARALPGVMGVYVAADIGNVGSIPMRLAPRAALIACFQKPLADGVVRYVGEPIALIVAQDRYIAEDALELIDPEFEELPAVADAGAGRGSGAPVIHPSLEGNVAERIEMRVGDPEAAMARAPIRLRERLEVQRHTAVPLETRGLLAAHDRGTDQVTVWGAAKVPHFNRQILADLLCRPENSIRLVESDVGGAFGTRGEFYPEDFLVPWAAIQLGRPVKWIEDRREHMMATNHSREQVHDLEIAVERDGTIVGITIHGVVDMGAYIRTNGFVVPERSAGFVPGPYRVPNYLAQIDCVMTNKTPIGSYRGPGRFESTFVRERAIDLVAREIGLDPAEVRRRNLIRPEEMPYNVGTWAFGHDIVYDSGDYPALFERALKHFDYEGLRAAQEKARTQGRYLGIGLGAFVEKSGVGPFETGRVRIDGSGNVEVFTGATSVGQGVETVLAQICAEQLDVDPAAITVRHGDTAMIAEGCGSYGSRGTVTGGTALWNATTALRKKMLRLAAHKLESAVDDLEIAAGRIGVRGTDHSMSFRDLARAAKPGQALPPGMEPGLDESSTFVVTDTVHPYGLHAALVEVDQALGTVRVLKYLIAYDIGTAINPQLVEGQLVGAFVQGLGGALLEKLVYSDDGQLLTGSLMDYLMPTAMEAPMDVEILLSEDAPSQHNALGMKGAGEGGIVGVGAAIANAVEDALAPFGVRIKRLPLTPNAIAELLGSSREGQLR